MNQILGKSLYAIVFLVVVPVFLWLWAKYTQDLFPFPDIQSGTSGIIMIISGGLLMLWAMLTLFKYGKGLPMNLYPPGVFVNRGPYRLFRHPIYLGFGVLLPGFFIYSGSSSGFWLVTPLTVMGMLALVIGYEDIDLKRRFPESNMSTLMSLPQNNAGVPDLRDRISSLILLISGLMISNFIIGSWNTATTHLFGEPVISFAEPEKFYVLLYPGLISILAVPFFIKRKDRLREWVVSGLISLFLFVFIALLFLSPGNRHHIPQLSFLFYTPVFLFFISSKALFEQSRIIALIFGIIATGVMFIQLYYSSSAIHYLSESLLIYLFAANHRQIWKFLKESAEKIANSWQEWIFGKVRVINHGFYVGIGAFLGVLLAGILAGRNYALPILIFTVIVTLCSALWAQLIEGSAKLKRPFGFYGGLVGIVFGSLVVWIMGYNVWVVIGVASVVMPWVQAAGRLRCLVNGCCHGKKTGNPLIGIRYFHPRSRVCNISGLKGEWVHPTQLYSILWLFFAGIVLIALWKNGISSSFIFGLYLILTGLGRFVEEAYRGEAQTPNVKGLHLYQWTAVASVCIGMVMTAIRIQPDILTSGISWETFLVATVSGLFIFFAMGVDFPYSNARFSRLV